MKWLRFSIGGLMALIIYVAVGLAALSKVDDLTYGRLWDKEAMHGMCCKRQPGC
jgi:hypothetical protein